MAIIKVFAASYLLIHSIMIAAGLTMFFMEIVKPALRTPVPVKAIAAAAAENGFKA